MLPDAPTGHAWSCPDCEFMASLGINAGAHMSSTNHKSPNLKQLPVKDINRIIADNSRYQQSIETLSGHIQSLRMSRNDHQRNYLASQRELEEARKKIGELERYTQSQAKVITNILDDIATERGKRAALEAQIKREAQEREFNKHSENDE
jgi:septal ring factor EnvC (AmiA/AmiB activator)